MEHIKQLQNVYETNRQLRNELSLFPVYCDVKVSEDILCFKYFFLGSPKVL